MSIFILPFQTRDLPASQPASVPVFLNADDHKRFERLRDRTLGRGFKLVMWETTVPRDRATVVAWLKPQLAERNVKLIEIDLTQLLGVNHRGAPQSVNVWAALREAVPSESVADHQAVLVLYGFEELMYHGAHGRSDLLQQMNVQRDIFVRDYPCWWLLLTHPASRQLWWTVAPDFSDFVALWIQAPLPTLEAGADRARAIEKSLDRAGSDGLNRDDWPPQLKAADEALRAARLDQALDLIYSFRAASDAKELTERGLAIADLLEGEIISIRGDTTNAAWQRDLSVSFNRLGKLATAQGNLPEAQRLFGESLRIRQRLAESDPANAAWQRDLVVSHHKLAYLAQDNGDDAGFEAELRECFRVLDQMHQRGLHFDPQLAQVYQQLAGMFGG